MAHEQRARAQPDLPSRLRRALFGAPRSLDDDRLFHRLSLVPFLAWVGLGAILTGMTRGASVITATLRGARGPGALVALGGVLVSIIGVALGWQHSGLARRRAWEVQAVGLALLAAGWLATVAAASQPG